ncbi:MAG: hypothetical protein ACYC19_00390 [Acidimicrobiales bacterium]
MTKMRNETLKAIDSYLPVKGGAAFVSLPEWRRLAQVVRAGVRSMAYLERVGVRPYLKGMTLLAKWADEKGYALELDVVLSESLIWAFVKQQPFGAFDYEPHLWRLAAAHRTLSATAAKRAAMPRPSYLAPYSDDDLAKLISFASDLTNQHRRAALLAIIALGAGCGISRHRLRGVTAKSIHQHGGETFVLSSSACAKVSAVFVPLLREVAALRPEGPLVKALGTNLTAHAAEWTKGRRGVPVLSADRLRATYVVALLESDARTLDVLQWTGLQKLEGLQGYLSYVKRQTPSCSHLRKEQE